MGVTRGAAPVGAIVVLGACVAGAFAPGATRAQPPARAPLADAVPTLEVPWADRRPAWSAEARAVRCAAVGVPDPRLARLAAARLSGRRRAEERAREALHAWADEVLARAGATPTDAARVHAAIDREARIVGIRPLVEGGAVVVVEVSGAALRRAARMEGAPW